MKWIKVSTQFPPPDTLVNTKIDDDKGIRNEQRLKKMGNLWWHPDGKMYVYYTPTHWSFID